MIRALALALLLPVPAAAQAWRSFEDLCIYHVETDRDIPVYNLRPSDEKIPFSIIDAYDLPFDAVLHIEIVDDQLIRCGVYDPEAGGLALRKDADAWMDQATSSGRYKDIPGAPVDRSVESTGWRETPIRISLGQTGDTGVVWLMVMNR